MVAHWTRQITAVLPDRPDLIVLPELCDRFDGTPPELLPILRSAMFPRMSFALAEMARNHACYIVHPTYAPASEGAWHNAAILYDRQGREMARYAKNWPVPEEELRGVIPGVSPLVADCDFGRVGFAICFDLNFEELLEGYRELRPDILVFPSRFHGGFLQPYWARELRAHFVGAMGMPGLMSEIWSPSGERLAGSTNYFSRVTQTLNLDCVAVHLDGNWEKLDALKARYGNAVQISDPGRLGSVLLTSLTAPSRAADLAAEFGIELLDNYLARCRRWRAGAVDKLR